MLFTTKARSRQLIIGVFLSAFLTAVPMQAVNTFSWTERFCAIAPLLWRIHGLYRMSPAEVNPTGQNPEELFRYAFKKVFLRSKILSTSPGGMTYIKRLHDSDHKTRLSMVWSTLADQWRYCTGGTESFNPEAFTWLYDFYRELGYQDLIDIRGNLRPTKDECKNVIDIGSTLFEQIIRGSQVYNIVDTVCRDDLLLPRTMLYVYLLQNMIVSNQAKRWIPRELFALLVSIYEPQQYISVKDSSAHVFSQVSSLYNLFRRFMMSRTLDENAERTCPICFEDDSREQMFRFCWSRAHGFHKSCIDEWIAKDNHTCPTCRGNIIPL